MKRARRVALYALAAAGAMLAPLVVLGFAEPTGIGGAAASSASYCATSDGSATTPGIGWCGTGEGFYRTGTDQVELASSGQKAFSFLRSGATGILSGPSAASAITMGASVLLEGQTLTLRGNLSSGVTTTIDGAPGQTAPLLEGKVAGGAATFAFSSTGKLTALNSVATDGEGVVTIRDYGEQVGITSDATVVATYANPAADQMYEVSCAVEVTAWTSGNIACELSYTDCAGTVRLLNMPGSTSAGAVANSLGAAGILNVFDQTICVNESTTVLTRSDITGTATASFYSAIKEVE